MCALPGTSNYNIDIINTGISNCYLLYLLPLFSKVRTGTEKQNTRPPPPPAAAKEGKALYEL
jgi:hypothetical protein